METVTLFDKLAETLNCGNAACMATVIGGEGSTPRKPGSRMLVFPDGSTFGSVGGGVLESDVIKSAVRSIKKRKIHVLEFDLDQYRDPDTDMRCGGKMSVLIDPVIPADPLVIFGAGHIGYAFYNLLKSVGFRITMVDDRRKYAARKRFPDAEKVICASWKKAFDKLKIDQNSYIIICTRAHQNDLECLEFALSSPAVYVGMLGSKTKVSRFKKKLRQTGIRPKRLRELHAPIGLDIGAVTPEEIAVSAAAELINFRMNRLMDDNKRAGK